MGGGRREERKGRGNVGLVKCVDVGYRYKI